jgi:predicted metal-binding membrane protein
MDMPMGASVERVGGSSESSDAGGHMQGMPGMAMDNMSEMDVSGMSGMGWSWSGFLTFLFAWCVMMAAMMFPAAAPMVLFVQRVAARRMGEPMVIVPVTLFTGAYILVWAAIGVVTWILIRAVSDIAARLGETDRERWAPVALGAVLIVGGLYQFTPLKAVCLRHCQSPVSFVMTHWREGYPGMLHMGITHGAYCLGCCWALFAVLVAAGVMSLAWMFLLTLVIFAEKVLPLGQRSAQVTGGILVLLGLAIAAGTTDLPWSA